MEKENHSKTEYDKNRYPLIKGKKVILAKKYYTENKDKILKRERENYHKNKPSPEEKERRVSAGHKKQAEKIRGRKRPEHSIRMRKLKGELSSAWKGGLTNINQLIRNSIEYKLWRKAVFERDNFTCIWCGDNRGGNIEADHIKPFSLFPELRLAIDNGRTLCISCHKTTDTWGSKCKKYGKVQ